MRHIRWVLMESDQASKTTSVGGLAGTIAAAPSDALPDSPGHSDEAASAGFRVPKNTHGLFGNTKKLADALLSNAPAHLSLESTLESWQKYWSTKGLLLPLMAATVPLIVKRERLIQDETRLTFLSLANLKDWPLFGIELGNDNERQLLNDVVASYNPTIRARVFRQKSVWHLGIKRRLGEHHQACQLKGSSASLRLWIQVWRDMGVIRLMNDVLDRRILPAPSSRFFSETEILVSAWLSHETETAEYVVGIGRGSESRALGRSPIGQQADYYRSTGRMVVTENDLYYICDPFKDKAHTPIESVGLSYGTKHLAVKVSPWCPLALVAKQLRPMPSKAARGATVSHAMGACFVQVAVEGKQLGTSDVNQVDVLPGKIDCLGESSWPDERRLPGVVPATWIAQVNDQTSLFRPLGSADALITHWMTVLHAGTNGVLSEPRTKFRFPKKAKLHDASDVSVITAAIGNPSWIENEGVYATSEAGKLVSGAVTSYRVPLLSVVLEEADRMRRAYLPPSPTPSKTLRISIKANRRSLHLMKAVIRCWFRAGMDSFDIQQTIRSLFLDLASGVTTDLLVRYQLVRVSETRYQMTALPFWSVASPLRQLAEQEAMFGGSVLITPSFGLELLGCQKRLALLARQTGLGYRFVLSTAREALKEVRDAAPRYLQLTEASDTFHNKTKFRKPKNVSVTETD
jgi:hypothetical protein